LLTQKELPEHSHHIASEFYDGTSLSPNHSIASSRAVKQGGIVNANFEYSLGGNQQEASLGKSSSVGNNQPHNNMPPWLALNWIIKY
jgi:microcystin-dependent protein